MPKNRRTGIALAIVCVITLALAVWGDRLGMPAWALDGLKTGASLLGALILASARSLFEKDEDHDGIPDLFQ